MASPPRLVVVHCPDWPVAAADGRAGVPPDAPVAVLAANRVVAASRAAREEGVEPGQRRRVAQARCPGLTLVAADPAAARESSLTISRKTSRSAAPGVRRAGRTVSGDGFGSWKPAAPTNTARRVVRARARARKPAAGREARRPADRV